MIDNNFILKRDLLNLILNDQVIEQTDRNVCVNEAPQTGVI